MWRKNFLIPLLIGARYPRDQQMIKYGCFQPYRLFPSKFLGLSTLFDLWHEYKLNQFFKKIFVIFSSTMKYKNSATISAHRL